MDKKKFTVVVRCVSFETWTVEAATKEDAENNYGDGHMDGDEPNEVEVISVEEIA